MKATSIAISILAIWSSTYGQTIKKHSQPHAPIIYDTSIIAVLPYIYEQDQVFAGGKETILNANQFTEIEALIRKCIKEINIKIQGRHINLKEYKRQYIAVRNRKGETEVWVNCFCDNGNRDWHNELVQVLDGGSCYFNLKINLTTKTYYDVFVNGEA